MILVLGGTSDSLEICQYLKKHSYAFAVSVTTQYGETLSLEHASHVVQKRMNKEDMMHFFEKQGVSLVIDATHPFAEEVSKNAINVCEKMHIPYVRYERESENNLEETVHLVESIQTACELASSLGNRIFLTTGSKNLQEYMNHLPEKHVIARVLPVSEILNYCEQLGLFADQIIAMKGPFSKELNKEMFRAVKADVIITKESGKNGGFIEKVEACKELNIPCIVVQRPIVHYPEKVSSIIELAAYLNDIA